MGDSTQKRNEMERFRMRTTSAKHVWFYADMVQNKIWFEILGVYEDGTKEEFAIGSWAHFTNFRKFYYSIIRYLQLDISRRFFTNFENNIYQINSRS